LEASAEVTTKVNNRLRGRPLKVRLIRPGPEGITAVVGFPEPSKKEILRTLAGFETSSTKYFVAGAAT
jgi:hypothetical protein